MPLIYEICGDEAWTHTSAPLNRYWCFFGGVLGLEPQMDRLETALRLHLTRNGCRQEVKWSNLSPRNLNLYKGVVEILIDHIRHHDLKYRQVFLDRTFVHVPSPEEPILSDLDIQFRICHQFLKHAFGLAHLLRAIGGFDRVFIRLDTHSSQRHKDKLCELAERLPALLKRTDFEVKVAFVCSHHLVRLCACDVLLGAAGSYGNKMHERRIAGSVKMTEKQKCRLELAKFIYERLRGVNSESRASKSFNWFESTGLDGDTRNRFLHKIRIWKFRPRNFVIDKGWQNDHLDKNGNYQGPEIVVPARLDEAKDR